MSDLRAYAIYDARVVFEVDLRSGEIVATDLYTNSLEHFDTGFSFRPYTPDAWAELTKTVKEIVERDPKAVPPAWSNAD